MANDFRKELDKKLVGAESVQEVKSILAAEGVDNADAESIFKQIEELKHRWDLKMSLDEMDAVAGGRNTPDVVKKHACSMMDMRTYAEYGCAATVEDGSDCWGVDGGCDVVNISYI